MAQDKKAYSKQKHRLLVIKLLVSPFILIVFILSGLATYLKYLTLNLSSNDYLNVLIFYTLVGVIYYVLMLPLIYYTEFVVEHRFLLSNQTLKDWVKRELKKGIVSFVISIPVILPVYIFILHYPLHWWILTALWWFFISVLLAGFAPILIVPLFYKYSPIKNAALKDRLIKLASKVGFKTKGVYEINISKDTKKANAALIGLGKQKRIVLCDTLINSFNEDEAAAVMAHELGHYKKRHILKLILFGGVFIFLTFFITNIAFLKAHDILGYVFLYDFESLVVIYTIYIILNILTLPIHNAFSKKLEKEADLFALEITDNKGAFISTMKKLAEQNLADTRPGKFYEILLYDHPPISRRISFAESFRSPKK